MNKKSTLYVYDEEKFRNILTRPVDKREEKSERRYTPVAAKLSDFTYYNRNGNDSDFELRTALIDKNASRRSASEQLI